MYIKSELIEYFNTSIKKKLTKIFVFIDMS